MQKSTVTMIGGACLAVGMVAGAFAQRAAEADLVWRWPASMDAPVAAPKNHKILFENENISLLEVTIQPGEQEKLHGHQYPSVFAMDAIQPRGEDVKEDGSVSAARDRFNTTGPYPFAFRMGPQAPHGFHNLDTIPQHFYRLQFKKVDGNDVENLKRYVSKSK
jgi:hypothetical protein